jgi:aspartate aminotransferase
MAPFDATKVLSVRTSAVEEAAIIRMAQKARDLRARGRDVVSLTLGEPDFATPQFIQEAAAAAMAEGFTHYSPIAGLPELRAAIAAKLSRDNDLSYAPAEIVLANGAKQAITNAVFAVIDEGDEAIFLAPYWAAYDGIVRMAGGTPVVLPAGVKEGFKVTAPRIADAISFRTKLLILNSPNNPSGAVWSRSELQSIAEVVRTSDRVVVVSDEIYEHIVYGATVTSFAALPDMRERTITVNGFSKSYAMTGWRLGYAAAPAPLAQAMAKVQGTFTAGANPFVQRAAIAALEKGAADIELMRRHYERRRGLVIAGLSRIPRLGFSRPEGTFYAFPDVSAFLGRSLAGCTVDTVDQLCDWLLEEHDLAVVPGSAFGNGACIRISFAASEADIENGLQRLHGALTGQSPGRQGRR